MCYELSLRGTYVDIDSPSQGDGSLLLSLLVAVEDGGCMSFSQALDDDPDGTRRLVGLGTSDVSRLSRSRLKLAPSNSASSSSLSAASSWGDEHACEVGCCAGGDSRHTRWLPTMTLMEEQRSSSLLPGCLFSGSSAKLGAHRLLWELHLRSQMDLTKTQTRVRGQRNRRSL